MIEIYIQNGENLYQAVVKGDVKWETNRKGAPSKLTFSVIRDDVLKIEEGNQVMLMKDDEQVFFGFIFAINHDKSSAISVTAYDQMRYLKNKTSYKFENKTASGIIRELAGQFGLKLGEIEETEWKIPGGLKVNTSLIDIILEALNQTLINTQKLFVIYDDYGKITLKNIDSMRLNLLIDEGLAQDYKYTSSIDGETYNKVLLYNEKTTDSIPFGDDENIKKWGVLQYSDTFDDNDLNPNAKGQNLLKHYNKKEKTLTMSNAFGHVKVRAGNAVFIMLETGEDSVGSYMLAEKVTHEFKGSDHTMNLTLKGGVFSA